MHIRIILEIFENYKCPGFAFSLQSSRYVSNEQPCLKTTGLYENGPREQNFKKEFWNWITSLLTGNESLITSSGWDTHSSWFSVVFLKWCSVLLSSIFLLTIERGVDISTTILDLYVYPFSSFIFFMFCL